VAAKKGTSNCCDSRRKFVLDTGRQLLYLCELADASLMRSIVR
jgi:hypothetical protein